MKKIKTIIIWSIIPLCFQLSVLLFLNNFYWKSQNDFDIVKVDDKPVDTSIKINVRVPENAKDVKASYNGKHLSYFQNGNLFVVNTSTGEVKEVSLPKNAKLSYYRWLPDRDRIIIAEKYNSGQQSVLKLSSYDHDKGERVQIVDNHNTEVSIKLPDSKYEVEDITMSTATSVAYIVVSQGTAKSKIYHMNTMNQIETSLTATFNVGNAEVLHTEDRFIYEDLTHKKLFVSDTKKELAVPGIQTPVLLGTDNDDNIYVGNSVNGKIDKVAFGKLETATKSWSMLKLPVAEDKNSVSVSKQGKVYVNDKLKGELTNLTDNKITRYNGIFFSLYDKGIITIEDGYYKGHSFAQ